jgi:hypothetical protein
VQRGLIIKLAAAEAQAAAAMVVVALVVTVPLAVYAFGPAATYANEAAGVAELPTGRSRAST